LLDGTNSYSGLSEFYQPPGNKGYGRFTINKVRKIGNVVFGDGSPNNPKIYPFIISGRFDFDIHDTRSYVVKDGRFDMEVRLTANFGIN